MPGRRCYQRERTQHAAIAPEQQRALHALLTAQLPACDRALVGQVAILNYLRHLGLRRRNGGPLTWRMILRWRRDEGFPLLRGRCTPHRHRSPALSTAFALTAWTLSRLSSDEYQLFRVSVAHGTSLEGSRSPFHAALHRYRSTAGSHCGPTDPLRLPVRRTHRMAHARFRGASRTRTEGVQPRRSVASRAT